MDTESLFDLGRPDYAVRWLLPSDAPKLQRLFEQCLDYELIVDGQPPAPNAGEEEFTSVPPGRSLDDKFLFGIFDDQGRLAGMLEAQRSYPDEGTWWIGLLLLAPEVRARGLGRQVVRGFAGYVRARGGRAIMLGVVEDNHRARSFWERQGFECVRITEPRQFGVKTQTVSVMRRALGDAP